MTTADVYVPGPRTETGRNSLLLLIAVLASPMMLVEGALAGFQPHAGTDQLTGAIGAAYTVGWLCSLFGMSLSGATGRGWGRALLALQASTVLAALGWSAVHVVFPHDLPQGTVCAAVDLAWPVSHLLMIPTGVATWRARVWTGWTRFTPLLCGLALPLAVVAKMLNLETAMSVAF